MEDLGSELRSIRAEARRRKERKKKWAEMSPLEREKEEMRQAEEAKRREIDERLFRDGVEQAEGEIEGIRDRLRTVAEKDAHELVICQFYAKTRTQIRQFNRFDDKWEIEPFERGHAATIMKFAVSVRVCPEIRRTDQWDPEKGHLCEIVARW